MTKDHYPADEDFNEDDAFDEDVEALDKFISTRDANASKKNTPQSRAKLEMLLEEKRLRKELKEFDFDDFDDLDD